MSLPRRTIPPVLDDPRAMSMTLAQRHTLVLLPLALDDHGRGIDDPGRLNGLLWGPLWREHSPEDLDADLRALEATGHVLRYEVDGVRYLFMRGWDSQQVVSRRTPSRYPAPPEPETGRGGGPAADRAWAAVDGLADVVAGAASKLHDPEVQANAVDFLAELAGQIDPALSAKVRERAGAWMGPAAARGRSPRHPATGPSDAASAPPADTAAAPQGQGGPAEPSTPGHGDRPPER